MKQLRQSLTAVCYSNTVDEISSEDFRLIDSVLEVTEPFRAFTKKLQQESVPTLSLLFPGIQGLIVKMNQLEVCHLATR